MTHVFTAVIVLAAIVLILVVLVQKSKGGGLSSNFASSNAIMGVHKTTDFVEKITWGLAGFIMVASILVVMLTPEKGATDLGVPVQKTAPVDNNVLPDVTPSLPSAPAQETPAAPAE